MSDFTVVLTEAGSSPHPLPVNYHFNSYEEALEFVSSKKPILRTIIYDDKGNVVEYIYPNGKRIDPKTLASR